MAFAYTKHDNLHIQKVINILESQCNTFTPFLKLAFLYLGCQILIKKKKKLGRDGQNGTVEGWGGWGPMRVPLSL